MKVRKGDESNHAVKLVFGEILLRGERENRVLPHRLNHALPNIRRKQNEFLEATKCMTEYHNS